MALIASLRAIGWGLATNTRLFLVTLLNGLTLASLYFIVASGFTLVFGLMRNVNLAHGSLYLLGGYVGFIVAEKTDSWALALAGRIRRDRRRRVADPDADPAAHAGAGTAPDNGHDRTVDPDRRSAALGLHGRGPPDGSAGVAQRSDPRNSDHQRLLDVPAEPAGAWRRHRRCAVVVPEPNARRHDDPRRRRRSRDAGRGRESTLDSCSRSPSRSAPDSPGSEA